MKFFVDSADTGEIRDLVGTGLIDGVTTNPSLVARSGRKMSEVIAEICSQVEGPVSAEVTATDTIGMIDEGRYLASIASNVAVKVPLTMDGLTACRTLSDEGTRVNVTLCFSAAQALLAAKAGATFVSPFVGRLEDVGDDGLGLIADICQIFAMYPELDTEVLVASVRGPRHVVETAKMGADVATLPPKVLWQLVKHPLTDRGLSDFLADWEKSGLSLR